MLHNETALSPEKKINLDNSSKTMNVRKSSFIKLKVKLKSEELEGTV